MINTLSAHLAALDGAERYRCLVEFLGGLAQRENGMQEGSRASEQLDSLTKRVQRTTEENARLKDELATTRADLGMRTKQLEAEQTRSSQLEQVVESQRGRLDAMAREREELEQKLVTSNSEIHMVKVANEDLRLQLQRAQLAATDSSRGQALESERNRLREQLEEARREMDRLRAEKDEQIDALQRELQAARQAAAEGADEALARLWNRLAAAKPPLAPAAVRPTIPMVERLFDTLIELAGFANDVDQMMRPFLARYTKHDVVVKRPWDIYTKMEGVQQVVQQVLAASGGKPVGVLRVRLQDLKKWTLATLVGSDSAIESIASMLLVELQGPLGMGSDPNCKIKDYIYRNDGTEKFLETMRRVRGEKLAEAYGHGP